MRAILTNFIGRKCSLMSQVSSTQGSQGASREKTCPAGPPLFASGQGDKQMRDKPEQGGDDPVKKQSPTQCGWTAEPMNTPIET